MSIQGTLLETGECIINQESGTELSAYNYLEKREKSLE